MRVLVAKASGLVCSAPDSFGNRTRRIVYSNKPPEILQRFIVKMILLLFQQASLRLQIIPEAEVQVTLPQQAGWKLQLPLLGFLREFRAFVGQIQMLVAQFRRQETTDRFRRLQVDHLFKHGQGVVVPPHGQQTQGVLPPQMRLSEGEFHRALQRLKFDIFQLSCLRFCSGVLLGAKRSGSISLSRL